MSRAKVITDQGGRYYGVQFLCPACRWPDGDPIPHTIETDWIPPGMERTPNHRPDFWHFDGNLDMPTFTPSILRRWGPNDANFICHSFVTAGRIAFCGDCTHTLAGQTVDLPEYP